MHLSLAVLECQDVQVCCKYVFTDTQFVALDINRNESQRH